MYNLLLRLIKFLLPIFKQASLEVAADGLARAAYPQRPYRPYRLSPLSPIAREMDYGGIPRQRPPFRDMSETNSWERDRLGRIRAQQQAQAQSEGFHDVLMVAFDLRGTNARDVHEWLHDQMPEGDATYIDRVGNEVHLDSWWVANDERFDRSDCDSAVFVKKGAQDQAREYLASEGLAH